MMFYKETNFRKTRSGTVPQDWDIRKLGTIAEDDGVHYGLTAKAIDKQTRFRMLRTTDIKDYSAEWTALPFCEITEKRNNLGKFFLKKGELVVARAGTTGVSVLIDRDLNDIVFGSYLIKIRLKSGVYPKFIHQFFQSKLYWQHISSGQAGSTLKNINIPILKSLEIPLPPVAEQKAIAEVLSTLDEAIQKTSEVIAKTERLKKGLMQELLTKGIGHKEFKDTEIGRIPKEWEVIKLENVGEFQYGITTSAVQEDTGINLLRITDISDDKIKWENIPFCKVTEPEFDRYRLKVGDVLFARIGATTGKTCYINRPIKGVFGSYLIRFISNVDIDRRFLYFYTQSDLYWRQVNSKKEGQLKKGLNAKMLGSLSLPFPPLHEQQRIAKILSSIDKKLEIERNEKAKLERIKQALMDLLLTGKIRVRIEKRPT